MNSLLLQPRVQDYIGSQENADLHRLLLQPSPFQGISSRELVVQISGRNRVKEKLPRWFATPGVYYPEKVNLEQCSSEAAAAYKAGLAVSRKVLDLTGGFGIDSFYFNTLAKEVTYCEKDPELAQIAVHNFRVLEAGSIKCHSGDGVKWLEKHPREYDFIYLDPSRRAKGNKRVFRLSDCEPDITPLLPSLLANGAKVLLKSSPLLDISAGLQELGNVSEVHIVAVRNEVKELLWLMEPETFGDPVIKAVNLMPGSTEEFEFLLAEEKLLSPRFSDPLHYLYEPNAAIMKSGGFKTLGHRYGLPQLEDHSHLYTSEEIMPFPGRVFRITRVMPYSPKEIRRSGYKKANISSRNFPDSVAAIRKRLRIADGGDTYLVFTRSVTKGLIMIECEKI